MATLCLQTCGRSNTGLLHVDDEVVREFLKPSVLWPVLHSIQIEPITVFPTAITCGTSKPENLDFLKDTVTDFAERFAIWRNKHSSDIAISYL